MPEPPYLAFSTSREALYSPSDCFGATLPADSYADYKIIELFVNHLDDLNVRMLGQFLDILRDTRFRQSELSFVNADAVFSRLREARSTAAASRVCNDVSFPGSKSQSSIVASSPRAPELPALVLGTIADEVSHGLWPIHHRAEVTDRSDARETLRAMTFVHRTWTPHAQAALRRAVVLRAANSGLKRFLCHPFCGPWITELAVDWRPGNETTPSEEHVWLLERLLARMPNVRTLCFLTRSNAEWASTDSKRAALESIRMCLPLFPKYLPHLEAVYLHHDIGQTATLGGYPIQGRMCSLLCDLRHALMGCKNMRYLSLSGWSGSEPEGVRGSIVTDPTTTNEESRLDYPLHEDGIRLSELSLSDQAFPPLRAASLVVNSEFSSSGWNTAASLLRPTKVNGHINTTLFLAMTLQLESIHSIPGELSVNFHACLHTLQILHLKLATRNFLSGPSTPEQYNTILKRCSSLRILHLHIQNAGSGTGPMALENIIVPPSVRTLMLHAEWPLTYLSDDSLSTLVEILPELEAIVVLVGASMPRGVEDVDAQIDCFEAGSIGLDGWLRRMKVEENKGIRAKFPRTAVACEKRGMMRFCCVQAYQSSYN